MDPKDKQASVAETSFEDVYDALGEAINSVDIDARLREQMRARVMDRVDKSDRGAPQMITVRDADESSWVQVDDKTRKKTLKTDTDEGSELCMLELQPGASADRHYHPVDELVYVLKGDLTIDGVELGIGDFHFAPKGSWHDSVTTRDGALLILQIPLGT